MKYDKAELILRSVGATALGAVILVACGLSGAYAQSAAPDADLVARGKYLATAGDCSACHTVAQDEPYAGGLKIDTPFGAIYSSNITPDPDTGIGKWRFEDFKNALHAGIRADGQFLYPAMPFDAFTKISDDDLKALWAYFRTLPPVKQEDRGNDLMFPFSIRYSMLVWRWLYFDEGFFKPDPAKGPQWHRGAYLVEALAHCGVCHTPRNFMGATIESRALQGARIGQWYAPNISPEALKTVNKWDKAQLVAFLKKGAAINTTVVGPMRVVFHDSLSHLTENDLNAIATYLLNQPASEERPPRPVAEQPPKPVAKALPASLQRGAELYASNCVRCHQANGQGIAGVIPPLAGNPVVVDAQPFDVVAVVLAGLPATDQMPAMPGFAGALTDQDVADIANYVRTAWGNNSWPNATPDLVRASRRH